MANYFRNENFEILKPKNIQNLITCPLIYFMKTYLLISQLIFLYSEILYLYLIPFF